MTEWFCYFLKSLCDNCTYIGSTNDPEKRLNNHNSGRGAKYTRGKTWVPIIILGPFFDKKSCLSFEAGWKKLSRRRNNTKLYFLNQLTKNQYKYGNDPKWNRIIDLLFFVHYFTYIGSKFRLNYEMKLPFNSPDEIIIEIFIEKWIKYLPWPYFMKFVLKN